MPDRTLRRVGSNPDQLIVGTTVQRWNRQVWVGGGKYITPTRTLIMIRSDKIIHLLDFVSNSTEGNYRSHSIFILILKDLLIKLHRFSDVYIPFE